MTASYFSANQLLGLKLRTHDDAKVGLLDLMLDTEQWIVRFLIADADAWAPSRGVLLGVRTAAGLDEVRGELNLDLSMEALRSNPLMTSDGGLDTRQEDGTPPPAWEAHWRAEIAPEVGLDPPPAPIDELESEVISTLGADHDFSADRWARAETLRRITGETADGRAVRVMDLLIDNTDWALAYLDIAVGPGDSGRMADRARSTTRCLVPRQCIDWLNQDAETLHLSVWEEELRNARLQPDPVAGGDRQVRILDV